MILYALTQPVEPVEFFRMLEARVLGTEVMNDLVNGDRDLLKGGSVDKFSKTIERKLQKSLTINKREKNNEACAPYAS